jgi:hypothetical protein
MMYPKFDNMVNLVCVINFLYSVMSFCHQFPVSYVVLGDLHAACIKGSCIRHMAYIKL